MTRTAWAWGLSAFLGLCGVSAAGDTYQRGVAAYFARDYARGRSVARRLRHRVRRPAGLVFPRDSPSGPRKSTAKRGVDPSGGALLAAGHGDATTIRRSLERVQGPARVYLEAVQSFYAKTHGDTDQCDCCRSVAGRRIFAVRQHARDGCPGGCSGRRCRSGRDRIRAGYPMPVEVRYTNCTMGGTCGSVVSTTGTVESAPVVSSGCGSTVYSEPAMDMTAAAAA